MKYYVKMAFFNDYSILKNHLFFSAPHFVGSLPCGEMDIDVFQPSGVYSSTVDTTDANTLFDYADIIFFSSTHLTFVVFQKALL